MRALILVDLQNDFMPGGALAVPEGDQVVPIANALMGRFDLVVATQDWHPPGHVSFASSHPGRSVGDVVEAGGLEQALWPDHCVRGTFGAEPAGTLDTRRIDKYLRKGDDPEIDSYSGFFDNGHIRSTGLDEYLRENGVDEVYILGLATDYCVKFTALDARELGFRTHLIEDACRGVDLQPGDVAGSIEEMRRAGIVITDSSRVVPAP